MTAVKAFYYNGKYYLIPECFPDLKLFLKTVRDGVCVSLTELCEVRCMAPYFTRDAMAERSVILEEIRRIYPVTAYLMDRAEYDARLRHFVKGYCPGCFRYGNDYIDLSGHHEEMSLDGLCLEREDATMLEGLSALYEPAFAVEDFWNAFVRQEETLRTRIDVGDAVGATAELNTILEEVQYNDYLFPAVSRYVYRDGGGKTVRRYVLMLTGGGFLCADLIAEYFIRCMPPAVAEKWDVYPYAVRGFFTHLPQFTGCNPEEDPPMIRATYVEDQDLFSVQLFVGWDAGSADPGAAFPDATQNDEDIPANIYCANYLYLCQIIGEERLRGAVLEMMPFPKSEMVFEGDCVTAAEFSDLIDRQIRHRERLKPELCNLRKMEMEGMQERRRVSELVTTCEQLSLDFILGFDAPSQYLWEGGIALGTVFIPEDAAGDSDDTAYLSGLLQKALDEPRFAVSVDVCSGGEGTYFDFVIMDKVSTRKAIRALSPVLRAFRAVYTERMGTECVRYRVDYKMERLRQPEQEG